MSPKFASRSVVIFPQFRVQTPSSQPVLRRHMPELDSIRGVAVLLVLFFHGFYFVSGASRFHGPFRWFLLATDAGWTGVNLFFVLSGFLITGILLDSRNRPGYYRTFYCRRALRILPAYYAILLLVLALSRAGLIARHISWGFFDLSLIYLANVTVLLGIPMQYAVLWSLAVEEHFYLLWPAVARNVSCRALPWICVIIVGASPVVRGLCYWRHYVYGGPYTWLVLDGLAWGALLATMARGKFSTRDEMWRLGVACVAGSAALCAALIPLGILSTGNFVGGVFRLSLINSFYAGVLALTLVVGTGARKVVVARPALRFFGEISYGLYLVHMLVFDVVDRILEHWSLDVSRTTGSGLLVLARFAAAASLSVAVAYLSRWYFEEPFLRLKKKFDSPAPALQIVAALPFEAEAAS